MFVTLIGPRGVGKSTSGKVLAKQLGCQYVSLDDEINHHLKDFGGLVGYAQWKAKQLRKERPDATDDQIREQSWYDAYSVFHSALPTILARIAKTKVVLDVGGGILSDMHHQRESSRHLVRNLGRTVLLLPPGSDTEAIELLFARERKRGLWKDRTDDSLRSQIAAEWNKRVPAYREIADFELLAQGDEFAVANAIEAFARQN